MHRQSNDKARRIAANVAKLPELQRRFFSTYWISRYSFVHALDGRSHASPRIPTPGTNILPPGVLIAFAEEAILRPIRERRGRRAVAHVQMLEAAMPCGMSALSMIGRYGRLRTERDEDNSGRKA